MSQCVSLETLRKQRPISSGAEKNEVLVTLHDAFMLMGTHRWHSNDFRGRSFRFVVLFSAQYRPPKFHFRCKLYTTLFYIHASAIPFVKHHFQFKLS